MRAINIARTMAVAALAGSIVAATHVAAQQDVKAAIEAANKQFVALVAKGDAAGIAAIYSDTAMAFPPGSDVVKGRAAIQKLWQGVIASGVKEAMLSTVEVESHGDFAHEVGMYTMGAGGKAMDRGKYLVIWKRESGQWKIHRDIWNTNMPPATP